MILEAFPIAAAWSRSVPYEAISPCAPAATTVSISPALSTRPSTGHEYSGWSIATTTAADSLKESCGMSGGHHDLERTEFVDLRERLLERLERAPAVDEPLQLESPRRE